jgi:phosphoglycolate phosphatase
VIKLFSTDLDNTVYNWVDYYVPSFLAMVDELARMTGIEQETLKASFKRLHERYGTSEYSFAIQQLDVLSERLQGLSTAQILDRFAPAIEAFKESRKRTLHLYDGVIPTLVALRGKGKRIAAVTDSTDFQVEYRMKMLGIEQYFDALVSSPDYGFPLGTSGDEVRSNEAEKYQSPIPVKIAVEAGRRKPHSGFLVPLLDRFGLRPDECVYVGDSIYKDIRMAQECGAHDILAEYGTKCDPHNYAELLKITYRTREDILKENSLPTLQLTPSYTIRSFPELLAVISTLDSSGCA